MGFMDKLREAMGIAEEAAASGAMPAERVTAATKISPCERALVRELKASSGGAAPVRLHLLFSGDVQGVGFRWTNQGLARDAGLTGWARNEDDGTVTMEIQGAPAAIARHLDQLHAYYRRFGNRIWLETAEREAVSDGEGAFTVRY